MHSSCAVLLAAGGAHGGGDHLLLVPAQPEAVLHCRTRLRGQRAAVLWLHLRAAGEGCTQRGCSSFTMLYY